MKKSQQLDFGSPQENKQSVGSQIQITTRYVNELSVGATMIYAIPFALTLL